MGARKTTACRYCRSTRLMPFLSLGAQPPSNAFIRADQIAAEARYPLDVCLCEECSLVQLLDVVPPETIFDDYAYLSSTSRALKRHYEGLAALLTERHALRPNDLVVDIGCNDGILLHGYALPGLRKVGVEPSKVADIARASGLEVFKSFFGAEAARAIVAEHGHAKIVTATNVFAHVDDISGFVAGIPLLLANDGAFVIEAPYLVDLVEQTLFDTIYHEHLCYLSLTPMVPFLAGHGLEVFDVERIPFGASGPALRIFIRKAQGSPAPSVARLLAFESEWGVGRRERYLGYARQVERVKQDLLDILHGLRASGHRIGGYGAPAKGNTLLNYLGLGPDTIECIAETNAIKQGLLTPGTHIPIVSEGTFLERMPSHALLLSWNYLDFFLEHSPYVRKGGRFVVPLPSPRLVS